MTNSLTWTGDTVDYENWMRAERGLPLRASYLSIPKGTDKEAVRFIKVNPTRPNWSYYVTKKKF